jgi:hypothetical protein
MIKDNDRPETVKLGKMIYKRNVFLDYLASEGITHYLNSSPFLNTNLIVDRVIRTICDKLGVRSILWLDINHMAQLVEEYNHTPHSAFYHMFTPFQIQFTRDLERYFMKENEYKIEQIKQKQKELGLRDYEPRNILLIHLDFSKTSSRFTKIYIKNPITIPVYYTKYI